LFPAGEPDNRDVFLSHDYHRPVTLSTGSEAGIR
jgi:hypothetical protein